jgi:diacylglycerol O-acyltransferase
MGERMTGADAAWLHMDRPTNRMIVNMVAWFDQEPDWDEMRTLLQKRWVDVYPRFRQVVREPPIALGQIAAPVPLSEWVDARDFHLEDHIVTARIAEPGDDAALHAYVEQHVADPLPRHQPLWQLHFLSGYRDGGAMLLRASHALGDGTALMHALLALADDSPDKQDLGPVALVDPPVDEDGGPGGPDSVVRFVRGYLETLRDVTRGRLGRGRDFVTEAVRNLKLIPALQDRKTVLRAPLGTDKRVTWTSAVPLDAVRAAAKEAGGTINDVLLAGIAAATGRYLREHGSAVDEIGMMLPFNLRSLDQPMPRGLGNKFGLVFPVIPVRQMDRQARIRAVHRVMQHVKSSDQARVVFAWISSLGTTPGEVVRLAIDRYAGMSSLIITNVPGPKAHISIAGTEVTGLLFWVPTSGPVGVGLSLISYAGELLIGINVDAGLMPDVEHFRELLDDELAALAAA